MDEIERRFIAKFEGETKNNYEYLLRIPKDEIGVRDPEDDITVYMIQFPSFEFERHGKGTRMYQHHEFPVDPINRITR